MQQSYRIPAFLMICMTWMLGLIAYFGFIYQLGFPDGFISELGRAQRKLAYIFIGVSFILSVWFIYLGMVALRKRIAKPLLAAVILYLVIIVAVLLLDYYFRLNLTGSGGG